MCARSFRIDPIGYPSKCMDPDISLHFVGSVRHTKCVPRARLNTRVREAKRQKRFYANKHRPKNAVAQLETL
jgi:hypothetical protein